MMHEANGTVINDKEKNIENVILLSMSTLPDKVKQNKFKFKIEKEERIFYGQSQLSPDTKTILSIIDAKGEGIDRIVILATKEAREKKERTLIDGEGKEISKENVDAVSFFEDEILAYVEKRKENSEDEEYCLKNLSLTEDKFVVVDLDKYSPENADEVIYDAVKAIKGDGDKEINLYINMQGGIRSTMMKMNAITELLESQNVRVVGRYANNYNAREPQPYESVSVADDYRPYELVTAMTIFKKYGRGEKLLEYFSDADKYPLSNKLAEAIKLAADSIQLCDVDGFDEAIEAIREFDNEYKESEASTTLKIIYQDIKSDYESILNAEHKYVAQIRWCLNKGFLQQAMTILESKMPDEYVRSGMVYFCKKGQEYSVIKDLEKIYDKDYSSDNNQEAHKLKNINHYLISNFRKIYRDENKESNNGSKKIFNMIPLYWGKEDEDYRKKVKNSIQSYVKIKIDRNKMNHAQSKNNNEGFYKHMSMKQKKELKKSNKYKHFKDEPRKSSQDVINMINRYLDAWEALASQVPAEIKASVADIS